MKRALRQLWPETAQFFQPPADEAQLVEAQIVPPARELAIAWRDEVVPFLSECDLNVGQLDRPQEEGKVRDRTFHTEHLQPLVETLQSVARSDPQASW
jgi:1,2-phenylacetyl-CoA epoxidase catalytic subunit